MPYQHLHDKNKQEPTIPGDGQPWGGIHHYDAYSRWTIGNNEFDDLVNWIPQGNTVRQVPNIGPLIATLASTVIWMSAQLLNGGQYIFALCTNGHLYQVAIPSGTITDCSGATALSTSTDIANWQGTQILVSDPATSTLYNWNGTTFATAIASPNWHARYITVFGGRVWGAFTNTIQFTDANSYTSLGGSAGSFMITDSDCVKGVLALIPFNGMLYIWGPNYAQVIGNLYVTGSPPVLSFTKYTLQSQIGINNKWGLLPLGQTLYFTNKYGIWSLQGAVPAKISGPIDAIMTNIATDSSYSAGYSQMYGEPCLLWNVHYPVNVANTGGAYTVLGLTSQNQWFRTIFGNITFICGDVWNDLPTVWITDGTRIWALFLDQTTAVSSYFQSKLWNMGHPIQYTLLQKLGLTTLISSPANVTLQVIGSNQQLLATFTNTFQTTIIWVNNAQQVITWQNNSLATVAWGGTTSVWEPWQFDVPTRQRAFGINMSLSSAGALLQAISIQYEDTQAGWGP